MRAALERAALSRRPHCDMYDAADRLANESDDRRRRCLPLGRIDLEGVDLVFYVRSASPVHESGRRARSSAGAVVIDLTQAFADQEDVPLIVPEVNPDVVADGVDRGVLRQPGAWGDRPVRDLAPTRRCGAGQASGRGRRSSRSRVPGATGSRSWRGRPATCSIGRSVESRVFPHRIAFNADPTGRGLLAERQNAHANGRSNRQTRRMLDLAGPRHQSQPASASRRSLDTAMRSTSRLVQRTRRGGRIGSSVRVAPGSWCYRGPRQLRRIRRLVDALETDATYTSAVCATMPTRPERTRRHGSRSTGLRKGAAVNAVQIAEMSFGAPMSLQSRTTIATPARRRCPTR